MSALLNVAGLNAWYGESHILHGVDLHVNEGEMICILGRNGMGKTTTLRSIMGILRKRTGTITFAGSDMMTMPLHRSARAGLGFVPEERGIFASLSVQENLMLPPVVAKGGMSVDEIYALFPNLHARRNSPGTKLSGGEQQMLAMARILRTGARCLLLDEPMAGMGLEDVRTVAGIIRDVARDRAVLMVEHNLSVVADICDRVTVLQRGEILASGDYATVSTDPRVRTAYMGTDA